MIEGDEKGRLLEPLSVELLDRAPDLVEFELRPSLSVLSACGTAGSIPSMHQPTAVAVASLPSSLYLSRIRLQQIQTR